MALITRLSRWFRADLNAVLDRLEEPDLLLRESIREMEETLARDQQTLQVLNTESEQLLQRAEKLRQSANAVAEQLDLCFQNDNEALARQLLRRRLEQERLVELCASRAEALRKQATGLDAELQHRQEQLQDQRQKADAFGVAANPGQDVSEHARVTDADVELAWLAERRARSAS